ncbi:hypothetical protein GGI25_002243 [Coemansia spiralis]|uniref:Cation efflux protein transmembrane domain-containing protein n=2 Tax=Coemansia TaxID=4863 RepID=A0A9W8KZB9_9FUNG|nr:cation efflux family-domain-containing protein [Coemansia spiralis]KAJ1996253.1 hypothetical protein EDC05_000143 [Coemansia umbellata]KAJ2625990.1 hypothetical protein GGI26_000074 [Coemansia sp. RSA 1358]KAJ2678655.1 hypothetical protein GGI25_002243 [Coemansia spiralis]
MSGDHHYRQYTASARHKYNGKCGYAGSKSVSWARLWRVLISEHSFIGAQLYVGLLHGLAGVALWASGIHTGSLALMSYSFIVLFDATSLLIDLVPRALEYSNNITPSVEYAFGLRCLPTLLEFTNSVSLLYRAIQALKEGIEHLTTSSHEHTTAMEFETYAHQSPAHNRGTLVAFASVFLSLCATVYSAARFANHRGLWELCARRHISINTQTQNVTLNPFNIASLLAGLWMLYMTVLVPPSEESLLEPVSCVLVAVIMAVTSLPACVCLGRDLLHATTGKSAKNVRHVVWLVSRLDGVIDCTQFYVWSPSVGEHTGMLRVTADTDKIKQDTGAGEPIHRQIHGLLHSNGLSGWTVDIRNIEPAKAQ